MAKQFAMQMLPDRQGWKPGTIVSVPDPVASVVSDQILIGYGPLVEPHRQLEMINGWKWLWAGVRDRNLLDDQFHGAILLTGAPINSLVDASRKTSSITDDFNDDDIFLAIGVDITSDRFGATQILDSGFQMLREYAKENP